MAPEEFKRKLEELHAVFAERLADLKKDPKWGTEDERAELLEMLDELGDQVEELSDALETGSDDEPSDDDD